MKKNFALILMCLFGGIAAFCNASVGETVELYLNNRLEPVKSKAEATYVSRITAEDEHGYYFKAYFLTGQIKLEGYYLDEQMNVEHGKFIFYYINGQVESQGNYSYGVKTGVWERYGEDGTARPERIYSGVDFNLPAEMEPDELPTFPGGLEAIHTYLRKNLQVPKTDSKIPQEVWVNFVVDSEGKIRNAQVTSDVDMIFKLEAVRLVSSMPKWEPGKKNGNSVNVKMDIPVRFF